MFTQMIIGPRVRKSPFFDAAIKAGASRFTIYNHMYMPAGFGDPLADYWQLINGVSMWDVACERQVQFAGPDAAAVADYLSTRDQLSSKVGIGRYAPMTNYSGHLVNDPVALRVEEDVFWLSIADNDMLFAAQVAAAERGLNVEVTEPDVSPLAIQGPKSFDVVANLLGDWVRELKYFHFKTSEIDGIPVVVARSGWSKQGGFELYLQDRNKGLALWQLVQEAGAPYDITVGNPNAIERIESGLISFGSDNDDKTDPFEMGLEKFVELDTGNDFVGKAALRQIAAQGPKRRRCGVFIDGPAVEANEEQLPIHSGKKTVGMVNAMTYSPRLKRNIAICLINRAAMGEDLDLHQADGSRPLEVTELPFL